MKRTVKSLRGLALAAVFIFVGFSSFTTPETVIVDDCGCPPGWWEQPIVNIEAFIKTDVNDDGIVCMKSFDAINNDDNAAQGEGNWHSLSQLGFGSNIIDNNKCN